jgi:hypothetical protein
MPFALVKIVTDLPCTVALAVAIIAEEVLACVVAAAVGAVVAVVVPPPVEVEAGVPQATASRATSNNGAKDLRIVRFKNMVFPSFVWCSKIVQLLVSQKERERQ